MSLTPQEWEALRAELARIRADIARLSAMVVEMRAERERELDG